MPDPKSPPSPPQPPQDAPPPAPGPATSKPAPKAPDASQAAPDPWGRTPDDLAKGYQRPYRDAVLHARCGTLVVLRQDVAREFARSPGVLWTVQCPHCKTGRYPVGEFKWQGTDDVVGT
jgi:hypothetical protein